MATTGTDYSGYLALAGTAAQVAGTIQSGIAASRQASYNARVAQYNAQVAQAAAEAEAQQLDFSQTIALEDVELAQQAATFRERQFRKQAERVQSQNVAAMGASGVLLRGSPLQVLVDNAYELETQAQLIQYQGQLNVLAQRRRADLFGYQATLKRYGGAQGVVSGTQHASILEAKGEEAFTASLLQAGGQLARAVGTYAGRKYPTNPLTGEPIT